MADTSNLTNFLQDVADAIKEKKEYPSSQKIAAADFDTEIASIQGGIDTSDATATADAILEPATAYVDGQKITGTIQSRGEVFHAGEYIYLDQIGGTSGLIILDVLYKQNLVLAVTGIPSTTLRVYKIVNNALSSTYYTIKPSDFGVSVNNIKDARFAKTPVKEGVYDICILTNEYWSTLYAIILRFDVSTHALYSGEDLTPYFTKTLSSSPDMVREIGWGVVHAFDGAPETFVVGYLNRSQYSGGITDYLFTCYIENETINSVYFTLWGPATSHASGIIQSAFDIVSIGNYALFKIYMTNANNTFSMIAQYNSSTHKFTNLVNGTGVWVLLDNEFFYKNGSVYRYSAPSTVYATVTLDATAQDVVKACGDTLYVAKPTNNSLDVYSMDTSRNAFYLRNSTPCYSNVGSHAGVRIPKVTDSTYLHLSNYRTTMLNARFENDTNTYALQTIIRNKMTLFNPISSTVLPSDILFGKTAYSAMGELSGTMPNNGALSYTPSDSAQTIPPGYTSGGIIAAIDITALQEYQDCLDITETILE